jgi:hypothetical protein
LAATAINQSTRPKDMVAFAHASLFSPAITTLEAALRKNLIPNFPGLTLKSLQAHPPNSMATAKGHLDQSRKNQRSTKQPVPRPDNGLHPAAAPPGITTQECYAALLEPTGRTFSDQTGRFILPSSKGNNYLFVLYDFDSNSIHAEPIPDRTAESILAAFTVTHAKLVTAGLRPKLHRLDNECSTILKQFMLDEDIDFQLTPPGMHRRNAAERAIRTLKNHLIAGICSTNPDFPLHLWDRLLPQCLLTLNLLRSSRINPAISAWAQVNGPIDFNRTPLAPPRH